MIKFVLSLLAATALLFLGFIFQPLLCIPVAIWIFVDIKRAYSENSKLDLENQDQNLQHERLRRRFEDDQQ